MHEKLSVCRWMLISLSITPADRQADERANGPASEHYRCQVPAIGQSLVQGARSSCLSVRESTSRVIIFVRLADSSLFPVFLLLPSTSQLIDSRDGCLLVLFDKNIPSSSSLANYPTIKASPAQYRFDEGRDLGGQSG